MIIIIAIIIASRVYVKQRREETRQIQKEKTAARDRADQNIWPTFRHPKPEIASDWKRGTDPSNQPLVSMIS